MADCLRITGNPMTTTRCLVCALLGVAILLLGSWLECRADEFFTAVWPDGSGHSEYSVEIRHLAWVVMGTEAGLSLIAASAWVRAAPARPANS